MRVGLHPVSFAFPDGPRSIAPTLAAIGEAAEEAGMAWLAPMDHYFQIGFVGPPSDPMLEGYTVASFLAAHTETVGLCLLVTGVTYRHPGLLAKIVTSLDVLSGGRAQLAIGAAWNEHEHRALGVPFPPLAERFERLEEAIEICLQMWSSDNGPYEGRHYQLAETLCSPQPLRRPHPPILVGGSGERKTLRLVARFADACNLFATSHEGVAHKLDVLRGHCDAEGRDYATIEKTVMAVGDPFEDRQGFLDDMASYAALGVDVVWLVPHGDNVAFTQRTGRELIPALADLG